MNSHSVNISIISIGTFKYSMFEVNSLELT